MSGEGRQEVAFRPHDADLLERREALLEILQQRFLEHLDVGAVAYRQMSGHEEGP